MRSVERRQQYVVGYRPVVHARIGRMLGIRQPLDGPVFDSKHDAEHWCIHAMVSHYDRRLGMSDAKIYPFKGMIDSTADAPESRLKEIERICHGAEESDRLKQ
jgi:hypothetical protein